MQKATIHYRYQVAYANSPFWAFAIHDGHEVDETLMPYLSIEEQARLREEDPYTAEIAELPFNRFVVSTSRFQLDINRNKENAVYLRPDQAWGLEVWNTDLPPHYVEELYGHYDQVYQVIDQLIKATIDRYGYFVVYDIHSYNAKRSSPDETVDELNNPQIIVGTAHNHEKWRNLTQAFMDAIKQQATDQPIDIRENVKFSGGHLSKYINSRYSAYGSVLSIEFRKDFMDEWRGTVYSEKVQSRKQLLMNTVETIENFFSDEERKHTNR